jgi:hypothetical protein
VLPALHCKEAPPRVHVLHALPCRLTLRKVKRSTAVVLEGSGIGAY